jgi:hypothetical protein
VVTAAAAAAMGVEEEVAAATVAAVDAVVAEIVEIAETAGKGLQRADVWRISSGFKGGAFIAFRAVSLVKRCDVRRAMVSRSDSVERRWKLS